MNIFSQSMRWAARRAGYSLERCQPTNGFPIDFTDREADIIRAALPYTMTTPQRLHSLIHCVKYLVDGNVPGSIVECGVWKGGSMMTIAQTLIDQSRVDRDLYLFDTFTGMVKPTEHDVAHNGARATDKFLKRRVDEDSSNWAFAPLDVVSSLMKSTGYPHERTHFVKGKVEETLPDQAPDQIALLRLDTDWYESTKHEMVHLFPRLSTGGVLIIDDYGDWLGARKAVDEHLLENKISILLNRIDSSARVGVKR